MTMIGQARQKVTAVTKRVSPAPRKAKAKDMVTESARENAATQTSSPGTMAATAANFSGSRSLSNTDTSKFGTVR